MVVIAYDTVYYAMIVDTKHKLYEQEHCIQQHKLTNYTATYTYVYYEILVNSNLSNDSANFFTVFFFFTFFQTPLIPAIQIIFLRLCTFNKRQKRISNECKFCLVCLGLNCSIRHVCTKCMNFAVLGLKDLTIKHNSFLNNTSMT